MTYIFKVIVTNHIILYYIYIYECIVKALRLICTPFTGYLLKGVHIKLGVQDLFNRIFYNDEAIAGRTYSVSMKFKF